MDAKQNCRHVALLSLHSSPIAPLGRSDAGGMNLYVRRLADDLAERGFVTDVFTRRTDAETPEIIRRESGARVIQLSAGPHRRLPKSVLPLHLPALVAAFRQFSERQRTDYDVLHSHYWLSGQVAMRYRVQTGDTVPFVHMFHTLTKLKEFYGGEPDRGDSALRFDGERCLIGRADVVIGATPAEREDMVRLYGREPERFAVIPPGVDLDQFRPLSKTASRRRLGVEGRRVILFVGRPDRLKGLDVLLRAVAALPDGLRHGLKVLLVGGSEHGRGAEELRSRQLAERLQLGKIVEYRGKARQSELPWYYSAADVCAIPSAYESFGMVAVESMACQTPPVASNVAGLASTIDHGRTGFLARPGNPGDFAAQLTTALAADNLGEMGRRGRLSAQRYTWERTVERTIALYSELAAEQQFSYRTRYASS